MKPRTSFPESGQQKASRSVKSGMQLWIPQANQIISRLKKLIQEYGILKRGGNDRNSGLPNSIRTDMLSKQTAFCFRKALLRIWFQLAISNYQPVLHTCLLIPLSVIHLGEYQYRLQQHNRCISVMKLLLGWQNALPL